MITDLFIEQPKNMLPQESQSSDIPHDPFSPVITKEKLIEIIKKAVALITLYSIHINNKKTLSECLSIYFENALAGLHSSWRSSNGDDNEPDISDPSTGDKLEIKVTVNRERKRDPDKISVMWRGGTRVGRVREGWHLLFVRSQDNASWAAFFVALTESDWEHGNAYSGHKLNFNTVINHKTCIPVLNNYNPSYLVEGFLTDLSQVDTASCNEIIALFQGLPFEARIHVLKHCLKHCGI